MAYRDLREFIALLEQKKQIHRIEDPISAHLEVTAVSDAVLRKQGPALLFENITNHDMPLLSNLFGTQQRVIWAMGLNDTADLRKLGKALAELKDPPAPNNLFEVFGMSNFAKKILQMTPKLVSSPLCQQQIWEHEAVDLTRLPIQHCWSKDVAPLITWGLVITRSPHKKRQNLGIYRQQVLNKNQLIVRWLSHRGGALDFRDHMLVNSGEPFPVAVAIGADPATILGAVAPVPDRFSEYQFAGLLRGSRTEVANALGVSLQVPARAEIILEGYIQPDVSHASGYQHALEGPFGDHTGYYNEQAEFPVLTVDRITLRNDPIYHSTYTGKPPDEPAVLATVMNELFIPLLQNQFPEILDFYLPPEACSYRMAIVQIRKSYLGHARRIMMGVWSHLRQFMYTKFIVVVDDDIDIRNWNDVIWAISTRVDPLRDTVIIDQTPIDYLDFSSPQSGLGSKMGLDATNKWPGETQREWGVPIGLDAAMQKWADTLCSNWNI